MKHIKKQTLGIVLLATPIPLLIIVLSGYAVASFVIQSIVTTSGEPSSLVMITGAVINTVLGILGLLAIIGIPIGMPTGIYLICTPNTEKK